MAKKKPAELELSTRKVTDYQHELPIVAAKPVDIREQLWPLFETVINNRVLTNKEIAAASGLSKNTVTKYRDMWMRERINGVQVLEVEVLPDNQEDIMSQMLAKQLQIEQHKQENNAKKEVYKQQVLDDLLAGENPEVSNAQSALIGAILNHG
jgi:hypothetical protein